MQELVVEHPVECAILMRRILLVGIGPFTALALNNAALLYTWAGPVGELGWEIRLLWGLALLRLLIFLPRPWLWFHLLAMYTRARHKPSPQEITHELLAIQNTWQVRVNFRLTQFAYAYLAVTFVWTWASWERCALARELFRHCCWSVATMVVYQLCALLIFYRLLNSKSLERGVSHQVLAAHTALVRFGDADAPALEAQCSVCFYEYSEGESIRVLQCKHNFHARCIDAWLTQRKNLCPLCARPVGKAAA